MSDFTAKSCHGYTPYSQVLTYSSSRTDYYNLLKRNTRAIKECAFDDSYSQFKSDIQGHFNAAMGFWRGTSYFKKLNPEQQQLELRQTFNEVQKGLNKTDILIMSVVGLTSAIATTGALILTRGYTALLLKKLFGIEEMGWIGNSLGIGIPAMIAAGGAAWLAYAELNPALDKEELISFLNGSS